MTIARNAKSSLPKIVRKKRAVRPPSSVASANEEPVPMGGLAVRRWHVVMIAGCNLRCSYCATDHGRFGRSEGVMSLKTAETLADRIAQCLDPERGETVVEFGGGETFLQFDLFIRLCDLIGRACRKRGGRARIQVTTNGVLLNEERLSKLARRRIGLVFSIDGPEHVHDAARRTVSGRPTFRAAFASWKRYQALVRRIKPAPTCAVRSVFSADSEHVRLISDFWIQHGVFVQELVPANASHFGDQACRQQAKGVGAVFLKGLREWAHAQARSCTAMTFLSDYRGPQVIFNGWQRLLLGQEKTFCTPARGTLAVGHDGAVYPCEPYIGVPRWRLGDIFQGVDAGKIAAFVESCAQAEAHCVGCEHLLACEKPCFGLIATDTPAQNVKRHCRVAKRVSRIVEGSFCRMLRTCDGRDCNE